MTIAIPTAAGKLAMHFGHCETFEFFDVDTDQCVIRSSESKTPPEHQPGVLPAWLAENGADMIIAGGMGTRARNLFADRGVQVVVGAPVDAPENLVGAYMDGSLTTGENVCDH